MASLSWLGVATKAASAQLKVAAAPEDVYDLIADVTRMGEWSPECYRCRWLDGATFGSVGARFRGSNRFGMFRWSRTCEVLAAARGAEFSFRTVPDRLFRSSTRWTFHFAADGDGTLIEQRYQVERRSRPIDLFDRLTGHTEAVARGMQKTLARVRAAAEAHVG